MDAGALNCRVTFQSTGVDVNKEPTDVWAEVATTWANVRYLSGLETLKSDAQLGVSKASIRVRYRTDINAGMRALYGSTVFDIKAVLPDETGREFIDLACETGANSG